MAGRVGGRRLPFKAGRDLTLNEPTKTQSVTSTIEAPPAFGDILCAIDGSRTAVEAARQASVLASGQAKLSFICVAHSSGVGPVEQATISPSRAVTALDDAVKLAKRSGTQASAELVDEAAIAETLLREAAAHDLLVVGSHGLSRRAGIMLGSVASVAAHRASTPVLIARLPWNEEAFPQDLLVASDGSPGSQKAVEVAARVARRHGSRVLLFNAADREDAKRRHELAEQTAYLLDSTGAEPTVVTSSGDAHRLIVDLAEKERVSLVVLGSRGLGGLKALGSVSERVSHEARCSVLIVREPHREANNH
jgi:nucleotide-binding universal stress UspA family protein